MSQSENLKSPEDSDSDLELLPTSAYPSLSDFELDKIAREEFDREFRKIQEELKDAKLKIQRLKIKDKEKDNEIENIQKEIGNLNSKLEYQTDQSHLNFSSSQLLVQGRELFQSAATQMTKIHEENLAIIEGLKLNIASLQEKLRIKDEQLEEKEKKLKERKCSKQKKVEVKTSPDPPKAVAVHVPVRRVTQWFEDYPDPIERPIIENKIPPVKDPNEPVDEEAKKNGKIPINKAPPIPTTKKPELKKA